MARDDSTDIEFPMIVAGIALVTVGIAWAVWPKAAVAATLPTPDPEPLRPRAYVPSRTPAHAPSEAPPAMSSASTTMPPFLASAPTGGAARERYFEAAVDAPTWSEVVLSPRLRIRVASDYLKAQGIRVPLWPSTAQRIADRYDAILPTKKLVDAIWRAAAVKVAPRSMTPRPDASRDSNKLLAEHEALVNAAIAGRTGLTDGDKKSIILGRSVPTTPGKVFIYGWHRLNGEPVQPVFGGHGSAYADYSHGTRLVSRTAFVDGHAVPIEHVFADPSLAPLVNESGTLTPAMLRYPTAA
jgi:hypothetical protein